MFTPRVIVIKVSKMAHFLYFLLMTATIWAKDSGASEKSYLALLEIPMDY